MKAKKNGDPTRCAGNLFAIHRGEVPYDRLRGIRMDLIDRPSNTIEGRLKEDLNWTIKRWEPRISLEEVKQFSNKAESGDFNEEISIKEKGDARG